MDFAYTPEQEELIRTLRAFARKELAPRSRQWDRSGELPWSAWRQMGELGLLGLRAPAAYGGQEADLVTMGIATEEIARGDFSCTYGIQLAGLAGEILGKNATEEVKRRWLPPTCAGEAIVALALTEPGVGSDAANLVCRAERDGDAYVITGEKSGITLAMAAQATILFAATAPRKKARGVTAFLVPLDLPGVARSALRDLGSHAGVRAVLSFDHVRIPASHRLGEEGTGFYQVMQGFDYNRIIIALACLGAAQVSLEETMAYVKERQAFGRALARYEGVSFPLAEAATHLDAARWLCYRGLWLADHDRPYTKESAMAKWWAPKLAVETIHQCLLLHGHYGYTDELPFEQRLRDVIGLEIGDGTAEVMKIIVARELMGRESLPY
ncbi:MAG TPA: cyclohexanecarboxyl-CoA dehydrogenase [Candidatus Rokubacteria bacterium]|nr:MAG: cyclohexanecarboxyl-CoA dehydrogenase [Candidatus Rokubacteria bacterium GWA2_73_35]HBH01780.1 cyclohexanecarboxyl-CoA dehydrogenase [Candidatus Rokubacteria bacterium]